MAWALFDLDDTLIDHDSFTRFTLRLLARSPLRVAGAVALSPLVAVAFARPSWRVHAGSLLLWAGTVGVGEARLDRIVRDHVRELDVRERLRPDGAAALAAHLEAGDDVAVVTACADRLAVPLCREIDPRVRVVASTLRRAWGGLVAERHCHGARKPAMAAEAGVRGEVAAAYGDSASDAAMLDLGRVAYLVNMGGGAAERLRERLPGPDRVECVEWPVREPDTGNRPDR
ncbi:MULTISPECIES: haloacid dehalogenase-like hydrolase [Nocardiopsis]|uniref:haloacid dehalogenase-like hydrolase n=1 Tax=Nocardiopsis TaxID=2013 RepID=UPI00034966F3|nr:haloacid dehalogenase-like hydrolase [Nocardiopsis prasina]